MSNSFSMYGNTLEWLPIKFLNAPVKGRHIYIVARTGDNLISPPMTIAFIQDDGSWTVDMEGKTPLSFRPNWFGPAPYYPPLPDPMEPKP